MASYERASQLFDITEILLEISFYLGQDDLVIATEVCKAWNTALRPQLFRHIRVSYIPKYNSDVAFIPSFETLKANSYMIRSLQIINKPLGKKFVEYLKLDNLFNLERFEWVRGYKGGCYISRDHWGRTLDFLRTNGSTLKDINIEYHHQGNHPQFWKVLAQHCTSLKHLRVQRFGIGSQEDFLWFWLACRNLETLSLHNVCFPWHIELYYPTLIPNINAQAERLQEILDNEEPKIRSGSQTSRALKEQDDVFNNSKEYLFPFLKKLSIQGAAYLGKVSELMKECPSIESFHCSHNYLYDYGGFTTPIISSVSTWPNLHSISLPHAHWRDENMATFLKSLNPQIDPLDYRQLIHNQATRKLRLMSFTNSTFGRESWGVLRFHRHTETLEYVDIRNSILRGDGILAVLTSCPNLKTLIAPKIHAGYISENRDQPWVCLGLEHLRMGIEFSQGRFIMLPVLPPGVEQSTREEMQIDCINQLCRLYRLKTLAMADCMSGDMPAKSLSLKLDEGLYQLAGLRNLEEISFRDPIGELEIVWMSKNWRQLREVRLRGQKIYLPRDRTTWWKEWVRQSTGEEYLWYQEQYGDEEKEEDIELKFDFSY
ncbi:hypothetical protein BGZ46_008668 [Entomortierella lignicola]|nr:hypothetical protein BGZ46_008668 [Entomortierella lignicola]